jgi:hypothetical protein
LSATTVSSQDGINSLPARLPGCLLSKRFIYQTAGNDIDAAAVLQNYGSSLPPIDGLPRCCAQLLLATLLHAAVLQNYNSSLPLIGCLPGGSVHA